MAEQRIHVLDGDPGQSPAEGGDGRAESPAQRADRNMGELLQEVRVAQTGVQILFGFLLAASFTAPDLVDSGGRRTLYVTTLLTAFLAMALLMAPVAVHRLAFRQGIKAEIVMAAHRLTLVGLALLSAALVQAVALASSPVLGARWAMTLSVVLEVLLLGLWFCWPMAFRHRLAGQPPRQRRR